jgi:hypothetical protein
VSPQTAEKEIFSFFRDRLNYTDIVPEDITNVMILGKNTTSSASQSSGFSATSVIVSFCRRTVRDAILRCRRILKGSKVGISEDLTPINAHFISSHRKDPRIFRIWSWNGKIYATTAKDGPKKLLNPTIPIADQLGVT